MSRRARARTRVGLRVEAQRVGRGQRGQGERERRERRAAVGEQARELARRAGSARRPASAAGASGKSAGPEQLGDRRERRAVARELDRRAAAVRRARFAVMRVMRVSSTGSPKRSALAAGPALRARSASRSARA